MRAIIALLLLTSLSGCAMSTVRDALPVWCQTSDGICAMLWKPRAPYECDGVCKKDMHR
jgi:hypothetical protein